MSKLVLLFLRPTVTISFNVDAPYILRIIWYMDASTNTITPHQYNYNHSHYHQHCQFHNTYCLKITDMIVIEICLCEFCYIIRLVYFISTGITNPILGNNQ